MKKTTSLILLTMLSIGMAFSTTAQAQETGAETAPSVISEIEVDHDAAEVEAMMVPEPANPVIDTVLVFSRSGSTRVVVRCTGYNQKGQPTGRARVRVYPRGVSYILASDLAMINPGGRFLGSVKCYSTGAVTPSAILTGPNVESLKAMVVPGWANDQLYFPLVATL